MTKKDHELIASVLSKNLRQAKEGMFDKYTAEQLFTANIHQMAYVLKKQNNNFDSKKFFFACGIEDQGK